MLREVDLAYQNGKEGDVSMSQNEVRSRFAPSPTGFMHVGNLRTALYEYLIARSQGGKFILRLEDTDRERLVEGAEQVIYNTLKTVGLSHDEGPDVGGEYGPYIQSQRLEMYRPYAEQLVKEGKAYYCFCTKERLDSLKEQAQDEFSGGYDRHCRDLPQEEVERLLKEGVPYVIRQKVPMDGTTTFIDSVFGEITVENKTLDDQILLKSDGFPTYNFANVIDDHTMKITHVVRGCEYLSSTPKYNLLYDAFGWDVPTYVHLPLILGKNADGSTSKLSKRHGATSFEGLMNEGFLPQAITNYIALLGWCPKENREMFTLAELEQAFDISGISKSPAIFDYDKLTWFNAEYIRAMTMEEFTETAMPYFKKAFGEKDADWTILSKILQPRVTNLNEIEGMIAFLNELPEYSAELFVNKKSKTTIENSLPMLQKVTDGLAALQDWTEEAIKEFLMNLAVQLEVKNGTVMWPARIAASGMAVTPGGAVEILAILGKEETLRRMAIGLDKLKNSQQ